MINFKPTVWGVLVGALLGISWLIWDWKFLWIAAFVGIGYVAGWLFAFRHNMAQKLREVARVMRGG